MSVALISTGLAVFATSAWAENPPAMFMPDETGTSISNSNVLSDRFDGTDALAHLTLVATSDTDRVEFLACPVGVGATVEQAELAQCNVAIGTDTTPNVPAAGTTLNPADEAYEAFWDIPNNLDLQVRNILGLACIGSATDVEGGDANCRQTVEEGIFLDDAAGGTSGQTTTGEIVSYCTADPASTGGPSSGNDPCEVGTTTINTSARSTIDARFKPFHHGDAIPNDGVVFRATTSPDVAGALTGAGGATTPNSLFWAIDFGADANNDPQTADQGAFCRLINVFTTHKVWECAITAAQLAANPNQELALWIEEDDPTPGGPAGDEGEGACAGDAVGGAPSATGPSECTLDSHYSATVARRASVVKQSFLPGGAGTHTHQPPDPGANAGCDAGETQVKAHSNSTLGASENVELCMFDQFGDPFAGAAYTEEATVPGTITSCPGGTIHDHDGDGAIDHCHGVTDAAGHASTTTVSNFNATPGTSTITSCFETEVAGNATGHGCANEAAGVKDTLTLTWGTQPSEVFVVFNTPAPTNPGDPCRTGTTFKRNVVGEHDELTVCTFDSNGNPIATDTNAFSIRWTISSPTDEPTTVRFNPNPPPQETSGSSGQATVGIDAVAEGDNQITATLLNANGDFVDSFVIQKEVHAGIPDPRDVPTILTARKSPKFIRGKAKTEDECQPGRQVTLFRRRRGPDPVVGADTTNSLGRWGVKTGKRRGTYYARIAAATATDVQTGGQLNCLPDQSKDVRRKGRRR